MSTATLDMKISTFLARKGDKYPELGLTDDRMGRTVKY